MALYDKTEKLKKADFDGCIENVSNLVHDNLSRSHSFFFFFQRHEFQNLMTRGLVSSISKSSKPLGMKTKTLCLCSVSPKELKTTQYFLQYLLVTDTIQVCTITNSIETQMYAII